jgi:mRNA-degrading endonuclease RelE of RelBE toxin-antitoxin system
MKYEVVLHPNFEKEYKPLAKKYPSLKQDIQNIIDEIEKELVLATDLGEGFKKIRVNIKSKGKGSSGGGRLITQETIITVDDTKVLFASIYNKGDHESINIAILKEIISLV